MVAEKSMVRRLTSVQQQAVPNACSDPAEEKLGRLLRGKVRHDLPHLIARNRPSFSYPALQARTRTPSEETANK